MVKFGIDSNMVFDADGKSVAARLSDHDTSLDGLTTDLADSTSHIRNTELNVMFPPSSLTALKNDGATDNTSALQSIINYAQSNNISSIYFPDNGNYVWSNVLVTSTMNFILGHNVTFSRKNGATGELITVDYRSTTNYTVTVISNSNNLATVTLNDVTGFKRGDVVKIFSDDIIPNVNGTIKQGEFKTVYDVDTTAKTLKLMGVSRYTYSTNIRLIKTTDKRFTINDVNLTTLSQPAGQDVSGLISVYGGKYHVIDNPRILSFDGTGILMTGCYQYKVLNAHSEYQKNTDAYDGDGKIGYTVCDRASGFYEVSYKTGNVRHAFTANGNWYPTRGEEYGVSEYYEVHDSISNGGSYSGICAHEGSYNGKYESIKIANPYGYGLTMRGYNHVVNNCEVYGYNGMNAANYDIGTGTYTTVNGNYVIKNSVISASNILMSLDGHNNTLTFTFENCRIIGGGNIVANNTILIFNNCVLDVGQIQLTGVGSIEFNECPSVGFTNITVQNNGYVKGFNSRIYPYSLSAVYPSGTGTTNITFHECTISWEKQVGTPTRNSLVEVTDSNSTSLNINIEVTKPRITGIANNTLYFYYAGGTVNSITINGWGLFIKPLSGMTFTPFPSYVTVATIQNLSYIKGSLQIVNASPIAVTSGTTINTLGYEIARVSPAAAVTGMFLQNGTYNGQQITVVNEAISANSVTFASASSVADGFNDVINGGTARTFIWNAGLSKWYRIQ